MSHTIELHDLLPAVFAGDSRNRQTVGSQIWCQDVTLHAPGRYTIMAGSGTGKSSLVSFIYGLRDDYHGTITLDGKDIRRFTTADWSHVRRERLALLPQEMRLFGELTVLENIEIKNRLTGCKNLVEIEELLETAGIADKRDEPVERLSIGQQQRVAIIRAVCQPFDFLLLDEPVSHLDRINNEIVSQIVEQEAGRRGAAIISTSVGNSIALENAAVLNL